MTCELDEVRCVADDELLLRLERLVKADRAIGVKLLVHLGEVEARKLYLERGYSSMYDYCMTALGMSEAETYLRLLAAKTGKRFPLVLERLAEGGLHLTAIKLLAPLLTEVNHVALLDRARGMSKRQLEVLVAELAPQPDFPERVRKLPESHAASAVAAQRSASLQGHRAAPSQGSGGDGLHAAADGGATTHVAAKGAMAVHVAADGGFDVPGPRACDSSGAPHAGGSPAAPSHASSAAAAARFVLQPPPGRSSISPLSPGRFKLELTLGQEAYDQLEQLRELLRHQNPSGEITRIVERALSELLERTLKQRFAQTASPRRRDAREQQAGALARLAESNASAADAPKAQPDCIADRARRDTARGGTSLAPDQQHQQQLQPDAGVAERTADPADAADARPDWSPDRAHHDAAHGGASPAAGQQRPDTHTPVARGADSDSVRASRVAASSRYVPRHVLREVYARDAGQCTYVSADGRRCSARGFLEVHHHQAFSRGGEASVDNLRLSCRAHNFWLAERELGPGFMQDKLVRARLGVCAPRLDGQ
jgi:hypothetical protein